MIAIELNHEQLYDIGLARGHKFNSFCRQSKKNVKFRLQQQIVIEDIKSGILSNTRH